MSERARRKEDRCFIKRVYYKYEPYITFGALTAAIPVVYAMFSFYSDARSAFAQVPLNTLAIATNKAESDKRLAVIERQNQLMLEFFKIPGREKVAE